MNDLITWLRAQLDEDGAALVRYRDGHEGPCLNWVGQRPEHYDEYDSCYLHVEAARATPFRDAEFGLREVEAKRKIAQIHKGVHSCGFSDYDDDDPCDTLKLLAAPFSDRPGYRDEWRP